MTPGGLETETPKLVDPSGRKIGEEAAKSRLLDSTGVEVSRANIITAKEQEAEEPSKDPDPTLETPDAKEDEELQRKIDPLDHAIAEMIKMRPAVNNTELAAMFDVDPKTIYTRRHRPVFIRYMIFLRKPGLEILKSAEKKAAQRLNEALDATKTVQRRGKDGKAQMIREPDFWVRIAAAQGITGITLGRRHVIDVPGKDDIPGVPADEVPELANAFLKTFQEAEIVEEKEDRKRLKPGKKEGE